MKFLLCLLGIFQILQVEKEKIIFEIKPLEILKIIHFDINTSTGRLFINRDTFNTKLGCIFSFLF